MAGDTQSRRRQPNRAARVALTTNRGDPPHQPQAVATDAQSRASNAEDQSAEAAISHGSTTPIKNVATAATIAAAGTNQADIDAAAKMAATVEASDQAATNTTVTFAGIPHTGVTVMAPAAASTATPDVASTTTAAAPTTPAAAAATYPTATANVGGSIPAKATTLAAVPTAAISAITPAVNRTSSAGGSIPAKATAPAAIPTAAIPATTPAVNRTSSTPGRPATAVKVAAPTNEQPPRPQNTKSWSSLFATASTADRAKLHYVAPTIEGDTMRITATPEELAEGQAHWRNTLVGYFIGSRPPYSIVKARAEAMWKPTGGMELLTLTAGFYIFRFSLAEDMDRILEGGPWFIQNRLLLLKPWDHNTKLQKINLSAIPIWVKIHDLPMSLWTPALISRIASGIGVPLYMDQATTARTRITYARVCIEVSADQQLPSLIRFTVNDDQECILRLEYDRRPPRCSHCCVFGHADANCTTQPHKEKTVWKPKQKTQPDNHTVPALDEVQQSMNKTAPAPTTPAPAPSQNVYQIQVQEQAPKGKDTATKKQSPRQKGKQLATQDNSPQTITVNNRFQHLTCDTENEEQDQTDQAGPSTVAGCKPPDPPPN